jgi:hypothetical protein
MKKIKEFLFGMFFGAKYIKHTKDFWKKFWMLKLKETWSVLKWILIVSVSCFGLFVLPASFMTRYVQVAVNIKLPTGQYAITNMKISHGYEIHALFPTYDNNQITDGFFAEINDMIRMGGKKYTDREVQNEINRMVQIHKESSGVNLGENLLPKVVGYKYKTMGIDSSTNVIQKPIVKYYLIKIAVNNTHNIYMGDAIAVNTGDWWNMYMLLFAIYCGLAFIWWMIYLWLSSNYKKLSGRKKYRNDDYD